MPDTVRLGGKTIEISDEKRLRMQAELPEILWIDDPELRQRVTDAWVVAIGSSSFSALGEIRASGNYDTPELRRGSQADHIRSVTRMAISIAEEMAALFPGFPCNRDILIAGCLCHDIGKVWEFDPENVRRWRENPRATGMPSIRHPGYGVHICLTMGLPEEVAHMAGGHSGEGELIVRSVENTILNRADYTFWQVAEAGGQFRD